MDLVTIDGEIFTMTHYDAEGSVIEYESDESSIMEVRTHDRYRDGYRDAEVILYA